MKINEKIKAIRLAEGLTQDQFCNLTGIPKSTYKSLEQGATNDPGWSKLEPVFMNELFSRYALWLATETTAASIGQVSPAMVEAITDKKKREYKRLNKPLDDIRVTDNEIRDQFGTFKTTDISNPANNEQADMFPEFIKELSALTAKYANGL